MEKNKPSQVPFSAGLESPPLKDGHKLHAVLGAGLKRKGKEPAAPSRPISELWNASYHGLDRLTAFREASQEQQAAMLSACAEALLEESYFIEKGGFNFNAKMILLSESTEEKMLYSLFASDEAAHLALVEPFLPGAGTRKPRSPFLHLMSGTAEAGGHASLVYLLQVLLEGWGLTHYRSLAEGCQDPGLRSALQQILRDEAVHHAGGLALHDASKLDAEDRAFVLGVVGSIFEMVRVGPQMTVAAVEAVRGGTTREGRVRMFEELDTQAQAAPRLRVLRALMEDVDSDFLMPAVEKHGWLVPYTAEQCADWRLSA